ncbi:MAG: TRAP transporter small permease [Alphaproteobacteria bacterium]|nr:TRAP transporter small permease [Alphaproteobacteria bacterium]
MSWEGGRYGQRPSDEPHGFALAARRAGALLGVLSGSCLFLMMLMTFADVIGRYVFSAPIRGAYELTELLLAVAVFGVLPSVTLRRNHVSTGLFDSVLRGRARHAADLVVHLAGSVACVVASYALTLQAGQQIRLGTATSVLALPTAPIVIFISVMAAIAALILALFSLVALRALVSSGPSLR